MPKSPLTPCVTSSSSKSSDETAAGGGDAGGVRPSAELTIYIVEDSPRVMERLIETVQEVPNSRVVGCAGAVGEALHGMRSARPKVLILDVQLRGGSCFRLLKQLNAAGIERPETVIIVTNYPSDEYRRASYDCGVEHFFDKGSEFDKVRQVLMDLSAA